MSIDFRIHEATNNNTIQEKEINKQQMSLDNKKTTTCFNTTVTTRSKIIAATNDNKTISLSQKQQQPQQSESNGLLSGLVIINLRNHDHRYNKIRENHDHDQLTHNAGNDHQQMTLSGEGKKKMVDIQAQGQKRKRSDLIDGKETVILERKRKNTSNHRDGENNSAQTSNSRNLGCSDGVDKKKKVAVARPETYTFKYLKGQKVLVYEPGESILNFFFAYFSTNNQCLFYFLAN